jgi:aminoglycoside phosphotransferase (APT) family kinase protein
VDKADITADVVTGLVASQFPQWADLAVVPVALDGWDNTTFRLGDELSVRLPSADGYVAQVEKEHRWLPYLSPWLPLPIPEPIAIGEPSRAFPRPWSVYRWIEGSPAGHDNIADETQFASDLARFLIALQNIDAADGPPPGPHSSWRGGSLVTYDEQTRHSIEALGDSIDPDAVTEAWELALRSTWDRSPVWVHGDIAPSNLLVADGALCAVIDFGCAAVGDPACDLVMAWTYFDGNARETFRTALHLSPATWARARGWALWKALITLPLDGNATRHADLAAQRWGWRNGARQVLELVLADHARAPR